MEKAFCALIDWLVFQAPVGEYKEKHAPEGCRCYRWLGPVYAGVFYCQVLDFQSYTLAVDVWDYHVSAAAAVGPDRDCSYTGFNCIRYNMRPRLPEWLRRRYRYLRNRITRYLIPSLQYKLTKVGLARCPSCGRWDCDGDCVPF